MRRSIFTWVSYINDNFKNFRLVAITLTYGYGNRYKATNIGNFMRSEKRVLGNNLYGFSWVAELQKRGEVHYHILLCVRKGTRIRKPDESFWHYGMSKIETAKKPFYIAKYTSKKYQKDLSLYPKNCRLYAVSVRNNKLLNSIIRLKKPEKDIGKDWNYVFVPKIEKQDYYDQFQWEGGDKK